MEAQEQTQTSTPMVHKVKMEAVEACSFGDEDQLTVSQILLSGKNPLDFPLNVYIVRANDFEVADDPSLPNSDACAKEIGFGAYAEKNNGIYKKEKKKHPRLEIHYEPYCEWNNMHSSDTTEGSKFSRSISDIKNFNIVVNGLTIDSELSTHVRTNYYDLCCTQKSYIHEDLLPNIDSKMAVGILSEIINIADAIRACKISTSPNDLEIWDKTSEAFGLLGMNVGFLRDRLNHLMSLSSESKEVSNRYAEASIERDSVQSEMKSLELKLLAMKQERRRLDDEMDVLKEKAQKNEFLFQKEAIAPW